MDNLDNAPMPPMGADDSGMEDPMGGADPNAMSNEDPMVGGEPNEMGSDDDELLNIVNGMPAEDKAAVIKYAKSMTDDSQDGQDQNIGDEMPMESRRSFKDIIDETINDVLDDKEGTKRPEKKMPKEYKGMNNPFKSPF